MAESNVYIITSGASSKIGVASNVDSRFRSYSTHNPNAEIHRVFPCSKEIAQRTEAVVKAYFANRRSGRSLEWFEATPYELEKCITNFLAAATTSNSALSRSALDHVLVLPQKSREMLYEIGHLMRAKEMDQKLITAKQNEFCEYFGQAFNRRATAMTRHSTASVFGMQAEAYLVMSLTRWETQRPSLILSAERSEFSMVRAI